jgi:hypothetical protein
MSTEKSKRNLVSLKAIAVLNRQKDVRKLHRPRLSGDRLRPAYVVDTSGETIQFAKKQLVAPSAHIFEQLGELSDALAASGSYINTPVKLLQVLICTQQFGELARTVTEKIANFRGCELADLEAIVETKKPVTIP